MDVKVRKILFYNCCHILEDNLKEDNEREEASMSLQLIVYELFDPACADFASIRSYYVKLQPYLWSK